MDRERSWEVIEQERRSLADLAESLTPEQWEVPSLCEGWRVRDVVAHVALAPQVPGPWRMAREAARAGGRFHRLNHDLAVRHASTPGVDLVAELREHAASRRLPPVTSYRNTLFDVLVHGQDVAVPLGMVRAMPVDAARAAAERVWSMGWPFWARRRFRGLQLSATDTTWSVGKGVVVQGPVDALLLVLTGRRAGLARLAGPRSALLEARLS